MLIAHRKVLIQTVPHSTKLSLLKIILTFKNMYVQAPDKTVSKLKAIFHIPHTFTVIVSHCTTGQNTLVNLCAYFHSCNRKSLFVTQR
jgi:hypothetical protein